jgi:hypothetical protein
MMNDAMILLFGTISSRVTVARQLRAYNGTTDCIAVTLF